ncbi:MAG: beta-ketoacyl-ACP synthase II [Tenericutes bacterium]|nr:beta-ketoacyl-ACP synthase II [Mycoplasmatota bacterium]
MKRRVVITAMGCISPIGNTVDDTWKSIKDYKCGIAPITSFDSGEFKAKLAAEVKNLDMEKYFSARELKFNARFTQFARIVSKQAMEDSKINLSKIDCNRFGVIIASGIGGLLVIEDTCKTLINDGPSRVSPFFIPTALVNLAAGSVAIDVGAKGQCSSEVTACAAGSQAIGEAFHKIRDGYEDIMLAGGSEASITPLAISGFSSMRALYTGEDPARASIPFDKERSGFVMGEGAAVLLLEELEHAKKRNAKIYAEVVGYGTSCDAFHITAPISDGSGGALAIKRCLDDASVKITDVSYINAHGTSTPLNDGIETLAIKSVFGSHSYDLAVSSTKSNTGHLLGAAGAVEAVITVKAIQDSYIPATINYKVKDENCDLDIVANKGRNKEIKYAMSNSLGFGGHNVSLLFKKWEV